MDGKSPFVLLDDARSEGASDAQLFTQPAEIFVARRPEEVAPVLDAADAARQASGQHLAGYIAYEAGLALEDRLCPLSHRRAGAAGPLVWLGLFGPAETIAADAMPDWLAGHCENAGGAGGAASIGPLDPQLSLGDYHQAFARLQDRIAAGDIYQANLTFPLAGPARGDPLALYAAIRPEAAAGYGGVMFDGSDWLLSFSPELFVSVRDGRARVKPMKGTRARSADPERDDALRAELADSVKDRAENLMIVDLMRNDLSRVARPGSVSVTRPFAIESYPTVHQMVTTVEADLAEGAGPADVLRALFPCGSITGAPKIRAMELIAETESAARGPYCGALGRIDPAGDMAFNVAIRTVRLTPGENGRHKAVLGVGSAIVADSDPMEEWRECIVKGAFLRCAAGGHDLIETMRFSAADGVPLLELHLERMKASALELGFAFDRHEVRNRIQALCFELEEDARLRLVLARSGATTLTAEALPGTAEEPLSCLPLPHPVLPGDWRLRHKTSDRTFYEEALVTAQEAGGAEAILVRDDGTVTEGCWTSIFLEREGTLLTPPLDAGLLPGVLRRSLLDAGKASEAELSLDDLRGGFLLGNAVRGLMRATLL